MGMAFGGAQVWPLGDGGKTCSMHVPTLVQLAPEFLVSTTVGALAPSVKVVHPVWVSLKAMPTLTAEKDLLRTSQPPRGRSDAGSMVFCVCLF